MARGQWLTPTITPPQDYWVRRLFIPADTEYAAIVSGALDELCYADNFEAYGAATPDECATAFSAMYASYCSNEQDRPFWEDGTDVGDNTPPTQPWYEKISDWVIEAFLAISGFPTAAIVYSTSVPKMRLAIRAGNLGALFRVLLDNLELYTGDSYAPITGIFGATLDLQAFATANGLGAPPWTLRIEHRGSGPNIPPGSTATLAIIRKRLTDEMPIQFRQTNPCLLEYSEDGSTWTTAADLSLCSVAPVACGTMLPFAAATAKMPSGYLLCDGAAVSRATYAALFALIGTTYGAGNGSTTFNLPDLRGRAPIMAGSGTGLTPRALAAIGGEENHVLTTTESDAHTHSIRFLQGAGSYTGINSTAAYTGALQSTAPTSSSGSGAPHNTMQPWMALNFIIKY